MAQNNFKFQKRQKELARKQKKEEKTLRKQEKTDLELEAETGLEPLETAAETEA